MQVGVGIARDLVALAPRGGVQKAPLRNEGDHVEVEPPDRARHRDAQDCRDDHPRVHPELRAGADRHDRLAQGDDHDQPVALGEMARGQLPALRAAQVGAAHVEQQRERPQPSLESAVRGRGGQEEPDTDRRVVATGDHEQRDVGAANRRIGAGE